MLMRIINRKQKLKMSCGHSFSKVLQWLSTMSFDFAYFVSIEKEKLNRRAIVLIIEE